MAKVSITITIDADVKAKAQELSTAINIFLRQSIRENAIPFSVQREVPNADTVAAMKEAEEIKRHPENSERYSSFSEALKEVQSDA